MDAGTIAVVSGLGSGVIVAGATVGIEWWRDGRDRRSQIVSATNALLLAGEQLIFELLDQPEPSIVSRAARPVIKRAPVSIDYGLGRLNRALLHRGLIPASDRWWDAQARLLLVGDRSMVEAVQKVGAAVDAIDSPATFAAQLRQANAELAALVNPLGPRRLWIVGKRRQLSDDRTAE